MQDNGGSVNKMTKQIETVNSFLDEMESAKSRLKSCKSRIEDRREAVKKILDKLKSDQNSAFLKEKEKIVGEEAQKLYRNSVESVEKMLSENARIIEEYIKGAGFIKSFEESFIVSVFGKVKSGKSYLGNYIMGNSFRANNISSKYDEMGTPEVVVWDKGKITKQNKLNVLENDNEGFGVASTEATSTIQYFKLGGLTWFDTPGFGSLTKENEELAEEYIKNSDLVVFTMNSDSAGDRQELGEVDELFRMGKPMLIIITQSDVKQHVKDGKRCNPPILVPKSDKDRSAVEKSLYDELKDRKLSDVLDLGEGKIITISTKLAITALETGDETFYEGSNIDELLKALTEITKGKAAELKELNPKSRFNECLNRVVAAIESSAEQLKAVDEDISAYRQNIEKVSDNVIRKIKYKISDIISAEVKSAASKARSSKSEISGKEIAQKVADKVNDAIVSVCREDLATIIPDAGSRLKGMVISQDVSVSNLKEKKKKIKSTSTKEEVQYNPRRGLGKILDWLFGERYEVVSVEKVKMMEMPLGLNTDEIENQLTEFYNETGEKAIRKALSNLTDGYINPLNNITKNLKKYLDDAAADLKNLSMK